MSPLEAGKRPARPDRRNTSLPPLETKRIVLDLYPAGPRSVSTSSARGRSVCGREVDRESRLSVGMRREVELDADETEGLDVTASAVETVEVGRDGIVGLAITRR